MHFYDRSSDRPGSGYNTPLGSEEVKPSELSELKLRLEELDAELNQVRSALRHREAALTAVYESTCWKLTAPIRFIRTQQIRRTQFLVRAYDIYQGKFFDTLIRLYRRSRIPVPVRRRISYLFRQKLPGLHYFILAQQQHLFRYNSADWTGNDPIVSVVIPIYNRTEVVREAIESVLNQTWQNFELILVLDGSPPETVSVVEEYSRHPKVRIFTFPTPSGNAVRPRNKGIREARGKYVAFLDSDDIADPRRLEISLQVLEGAGVDVVYGAWRALLDGTRKVDDLVDGQVIFSPDCDAEMLRRVCVPCQSTVTVRRSCFEAAGFVKPAMRYREDHELWARLAHFGAKFKSVNAVLSSIRLHAGNNELNFKADDAKWGALVEKEFREKGPVVKKVVFIVDGIGISGGTAVVIRHALYLQELGYDVTFIDIGNGYNRNEWWPGLPIPIVHIHEVRGYELRDIDILIATFWTTATWLSEFEAKRKIYFVQSDERLFYSEPEMISKVASTYRQEWEYVVVSPWISRMLKDEFGQRAKIAMNGIDHKVFYPDRPLRSKPQQKLRVLLEGPISLPMKGVADAYAAVSGEDCEIWIVSSAGRPPESWRYDCFFESVPAEEMRRIYGSCDVLVKMSRVESFCLPALEAMACGCCVIVSAVDGGIEYLQNGENAIVCEKGDIAGVRAALRKLAGDENLRRRLQQGGFETAKKLSLEASDAAFLKAIEGAEV